MQARGDHSLGRILALKGLGGFQLIVDARNEAAVRPASAAGNIARRKPFALMAPSLDAVRQACSVSELEERLLLSPESPIVHSRAQGERSTAWPHPSRPGNPYLGFMLPYTPLHHLLLRELGFEIVATSGNLSDEPICIDEHEAIERLGGIADAFLVHDRPIVRHVDDSVVRVMRDRELVLRRARGYAPLPVHLKNPLPCVLAVGGHLKNSVALSVGAEVFISQHIGDLGQPPGVPGVPPGVGGSASSSGRRRRRSSPATCIRTISPRSMRTVARRRQARSSIIGRMSFPAWRKMKSSRRRWEFRWDGTGYGTDGTIWGGEFLLARGDSFERVARFRQFRLPGGEAAISQPSRTALGVLFEIWGSRRAGANVIFRPFAISRPRNSGLSSRMLAKGLNSPVTSSAGRLFDAVASLIGLRHRASFEGQAAMELEFALQRGDERLLSVRDRR